MTQIILTSSIPVSEKLLIPRVHALQGKAESLRRNPSFKVE